MVGGFAVAATGLFLFTGIGVHTNYLIHLLPAEIIVSFGMGSAFVPLSSTALIGVDPNDAGVASAMVNTTQQTGASLGVSLLNTVAATATTNYLIHHGTNPLARAQAVVHGYTTSFTISAALLALAAITTVSIMRATRRTTWPRSRQSSPSRWRPEAGAGGGSMVSRMFGQGAGTNVPAPCLLLSGALCHQVPCAIAANLSRRPCHPPGESNPERISSSLSPNRSKSRCSRLDAGAVVTHAYKANLELSHELRVELPVRPDLPGENQPTRRIPRNHVAPLALRAVFADLVPAPARGGSRTTRSSSAVPMWCSRIHQASILSVKT